MPALEDKGCIAARLLVFGSAGFLLFSAILIATGQDSEAAPVTFSLRARISMRLFVTVATVGLLALPCAQWSIVPLAVPVIMMLAVGVELKGITPKAATKELI